MGGRIDRTLDAPDSAWWYMEDATNQMVITGVLTFDAPLPYARVREVLATKLLRYAQFRTCIVPSPLPFVRPRWVEDEALSLDHHVQCIRLPEPADRDELQALVGELMSTPLDYRRPLWQFHFVENFEGGSALIARIHHCVADGMALIHVLLSLDDDPGNDRTLSEWTAQRRKWLTRRPPPPQGWVETLRRSRLARGVAVGAAAAADLARLVAMPFDPATRLRGSLGVRKVAAWSRPFALSDVKAIGKELDATVNDVVTSLVAGTLRGYLLARGVDPAGLRLHAVVPVDLRRDPDHHLLGNKFGLVFLPLPVDIADPVERLLAVKRAMDRLKRSPQAFVTYALLHLFGRLGRLLLRLAVDFLGRKGTLVMTDVPGPREPLYFCGTRLRSVMAWVPQSGRLGMGISVISYADEMLMGAATDARLVPDPQALVEGFQACTSELLERAGLALHEVA